MENPQQFWDNRYSETAYTYGTQPNVYFKKQLDAIPKPGRLLLLAEGEGRNAVYAAQKGWVVTAVDFSQKGKKKALALAAEMGVRLDYQIVDIQQYDMLQNDPWDAIGLIYAHFSPEIRVETHQKCVQALRLDGQIILEAFNGKQISRSSGGPKDPDMLYSISLLEADFEGLDVLEAAEPTIYLTEGEGHLGPAEVVQLLLKKRSAPGAEK